MVRLIIAVVVGLAIAIGGSVLVFNVLSSHGSSTPSTSATYNYGSRLACRGSAQQQPGGEFEVAAHVVGRSPPGHPRDQVRQPHVADDPGDRHVVG